MAQESQIEGKKFWRATHFSIQIASDSIKNCEPEKFREWKWFSREELEGVYDSIYKVDKLIVDFHMGRAEVPKIAAPLFILAWTTTPWTIPAHMALAVNSELDYVLVESEGAQYILAKNRAEMVFK